MKYKVGDKVMVRGDLEVGEKYGIKVFTNEKAKYKGEILEIFDILKQDGAYQYRLVNSSWYSSEMLRPAEFKIWCETEEEEQAVLEELEKEGYVFASGLNPTEFMIRLNKAGLYIGENKITWDDEREFFINVDKPEFTPSEFTGIDFPKKIIITKTETGATATYGDKTVTTEGEFKEASRQALAEALCPFKVEDWVQHKDDWSIRGMVSEISPDMEVRVCSGVVDTWIEFEKIEPCAEPSYNAKLFCIKGSGTFEQGVVYTVKNGVFTGIHGSHFKNLDDINEHLIAQFMEVKGGLDD